MRNMIFAAILAGCAVAPATAQQCIDTARGYVALAEDGFQRESTGTAETDVIEIWVRPDGRFAIFYRTPTGLSCIIVMGENFEEYARGVQG